LNRLPRVFCFVLLVALSIVALPACGQQSVPPTVTPTPTLEKPTAVSYNALDLVPAAHRTFDELWDLTKGDLVVSYDLDLNGIKSRPDEETAWVTVGVTGGAKGWMSSGSPRSLYQNPNMEDYVDKHYLTVMGTFDERSYDASDPKTIGKPLGSYSSYGIWFDRDGINQQQIGNWGMIDGKTYNTGAKYSIMITFHAVDAKNGTMFATVNGIKTGFYKSDWKNNQPDFYPAGRSITGDLNKVQLSASEWAPDGSYGGARLTNISVTGFPSNKK
jgi:hypothetical protein